MKVIEGKVFQEKERVVLRWWVVISVVGVLAGVPGVAAARLLSAEMSAASDQTQAYELDSAGDAAAKTSCGDGSGAKVTVKWTEDHAALADGFEILRRDGSGKFVSVGVVSVAGDAKFSDDKVAPGATYTYAVRALNSAWNGHESTTVPVTVPSCT
jgi:hypothetical protein